MTRNDREVAWKNIRVIELVYVVVFSGLFLLGLRSRPSDLVFWVFSLAAFGGGALIFWRQYQVLDEFGKLRFLKSWMIGGMVMSNGLALLLLWILFNYPDLAPQMRPPPELFRILFWGTYGSLIAGLLAMGLTNLYFRRQQTG